MGITNYEDKATGEIVFSDSFKKTKENKFYFEVDTKMMVPKTDSDVDIGANPSAEEEGETYDQDETTKARIPDVVNSAPLKEGFFSKKIVKDYLVSINKDLVEKHGKESEEFKEFKAWGIEFLQWFNEKLKEDKEFFKIYHSPKGLDELGGSDCLPILAYYGKEEDDEDKDKEGPTLLYFKHFLEEVRY